MTRTSRRVRAVVCDVLSFLEFVLKGINKTKTTIKGKDLEECIMEGNS
jgi:hypothetical protein